MDKGGEEQYRNLHADRAEREYRADAFEEDIQEIGCLLQSAGSLGGI